MTRFKDNFEFFWNGLLRRWQIWLNLDNFSMSKNCLDFSERNLIFRTNFSFQFYNFNVLINFLKWAQFLSDRHFAISKSIKIFFKPDNFYPKTYLNFAYHKLILHNRIHVIAYRQSMHSFRRSTNFRSCRICQIACPLGNLYWTRYFHVRFVIVTQIWISNSTELCYRIQELFWKFIFIATSHKLSLMCLLAQKDKWHANT